MIATIVTNLGSFTLDIDHYLKEWTSYLISLGGVFSGGVWTLQIKHLDLVKGAITKNGWEYTETSITPDVHKIELTFDNMKLPPRDYQKVSATLMANSDSFGLFDDCGLGKTISSLAALNELPTENVLVVAEIKSLHQWESEIDKFLFDKTTQIIRGTPAVRKKLWAGDYDLYITNYHTLLKDFKHMDRDWDLIVYDEASRYMRNRNTKLAGCGRSLKSKKKWVLTGSPIENNLADIFSLYEIMDETILGNWKTFEKEHIKYKDIIVGRYFNGSKMVNRIVKKINGYRNQEKVKKDISPFFIRRTERDVKGEIPALIEQDIFLEMNPKQQEIYQMIVKEIEDIAKNNKIQITSLGQLIKLRRVCDSSHLVDPNTDDSCKFDEIEKLLYENRHRKIIIFSQWTDPLFLLSKNLENYSVITGDGSKFGKHYVEEEIDKFMNGPNNILLSSDAGSRSLNLQKASMIINLDLPWNPQTIKQRIGRIRRIGSEHHSVLVYNLFCKGTIEENLIPLLRYKLKLAEDMIDRNVYNQYKNISVEQFLGGIFR